MSLLLPEEFFTRAADFRHTAVVLERVPN